MSDSKPQTVLAVDTVGSSLAASLSYQGMIFQRTTLSRKHANHLTPLISTLCDSVGIVPDNIDQLAVNVGPGPFTGLRVGLAYVRGLAHALSCPVIPITHSALLAHHAMRYVGNQDIPCQHIATLIDARLGQVYFSVYSARNGLINIHTSDCILDYDQVPDLSNFHHCVTAGDDWQSLADQLSTECSLIPHIAAVSLDDTRDFDAELLVDCHKLTAMTRATSMLLMIDMLQEQGQLDRVDAESLSPLYVRHNVAKKMIDRDSSNPNSA